MRLALFMIVAMALLHKAGMSSRLSESESSSLACVCVCLVYWGSVVDGVLVCGLEIMCLAVFLSRVIYFNYIVSDFMMGDVVLWLYRFLVVEL